MSSSAASDLWRRREKSGAALGTVMDGSRRWAGLRARLHRIGAAPISDERSGGGIAMAVVVAAARGGAARSDPWPYRGRWQSSGMSGLS